MSHTDLDLSGRCKSLPSNSFVGVQDVLKMFSIHVLVYRVTISCLPRCLEDVLETSLRRLRGMLRRCLEDVLKTSLKTRNFYSKNVLKTSCRPTNVCREGWLYKRSPRGAFGSFEKSSESSFFTPTLNHVRSDEYTS